MAKAWSPRCECTNSDYAPLSNQRKSLGDHCQRLLPPAIAQKVPLRREGNETRLQTEGKDLASTRTGRSTFTTTTTKARARGFAPRPLHLPEEKLGVGDASVYCLMDRVEAIDCEVGVPFGWSFLVTHGNRVEPEVGQAIVKGLRDERVILPDRDAPVLLRWAERPYGF